MGHLLAVRHSGRVATGHGLQRGFENIHGFVELLVTDDERHQQPDHVAVSTGRNRDHAMLVTILDNLLCLFVGGLQCLFRSHQFHGAHGAHPVNGSDDRKFDLPSFRACQKAVADLRRPSAKLFVLDHLQDRKRGFAGNGISAEGPTDTADAGSVHDLGSPGDAGNGQSATERLSRDQQVRLDAELLACEHGSGARDARLDFVGNKEDAVLAADHGQSLEEPWRRGHEASLTENRLRDHSCDRFRGDNALENIFQSAGAAELAGGILQSIRAAIAVRISNPVDIAHERLEAGLIGMRLAGQRHGHHGAAMESVVEADDGRTLGVGTRDLNSVLDRFRAAVRKKCLLWKFAGNNLVESLGQCDIGLVRRNAETGVQVTLELSSHTLQHGRGAMTDVRASDAASEIDVAVAVHILDDRSLGARGEDRRRMEDATGHGLLATLHQRLREWAGDGGSDLDACHLRLSVPADRLLVQIDVHLLGLEILFESPGTELTSKAGLFVPAPRRFDVSRLHVVDPHDASAQRFDHAHSLEDVARPDCGGESIRRIVGDAQRVSLAVEWDHCSNGSEDLFARDAGRIIDIIEDGGLDVVSLGECFGAAATGADLGLLLTDLLILQDAVILFLTDQRSHLGITIERRAKLDALSLLNHRIDELAVDLLLNQDAATGGTDFSLVDEDAEQGSVDGVLEIRVGEKYVGRLAAELERHALNIFRRRPQDDLADACAAGEGDLVDLRMIHYGSASALAKSGDDVHHSGW